MFRLEELTRRFYKNVKRLTEANSGKFFIFSNLLFNFEREFPVVKSLDTCMSISKDKSSVHYACKRCRSHVHFVTV